MKYHGPIQIFQSSTTSPFHPMSGNRGSWCHIHDFYSHNILWHHWICYLVWCMMWSLYQRPHLPLEILVLMVTYQGVENESILLQIYPLELEQTILMLMSQFYDNWSLGNQIMQPSCLKYRHISAKPEELKVYLCVIQTLWASSHSFQNFLVLAGTLILVIVVGIVKL